LVRDLGGGVVRGTATPHLRIVRRSFTASSSLRNTETSSASDSTPLPSASAAVTRAARVSLTPAVPNRAFTVTPPASPASTLCAIVVRCLRCVFDPAVSMRNARTALSTCAAASA
jgi:hypothetical protein